MREPEQNGREGRPGRLPALSAAAILCVLLTAPSPAAGRQDRSDAAQSNGSTAQSKDGTAQSTDGTAQSKDNTARCRNDSHAAGCSGKSASEKAAAPAASPSPAKPLNEAFPFPAEDSKKGGETHGNALPEMPTSGVPDPPAESEKPLRLPPSSDGGSSSSSSSSDDAAGAAAPAPDDDADVAPTTAAPNAPVKATRLKDLGSRGDTSAARAKLEETRVEDDLRVGRFYLNDGNAQGAYLRFKDAVDHAPDNPDARFLLAQVADRMSKRDEAIVNYKQYLALDPDGDHDKAARKALEKLGAQAQR